jgi:hypothetical protein
MKTFLINKYMNVLFSCLKILLCQPKMSQFISDDDEHMITILVVMNDCDNTNEKM